MSQYAPIKSIISLFLLTLGLIFMIFHYRASEVWMQLGMFTVGLFLFLIGLVEFKEYDL